MTYVAPLTTSLSSNDSLSREVQTKKLKKRSIYSAAKRMFSSYTQRFRKLINVEIGQEKQERISQACM